MADRKDEAMRVWLDAANAFKNYRPNTAGIAIEECDEAAATVIRAALDKARDDALGEALAYFEDIASLTENPLYNPLEVGFRHSPLSPKEREERYATACSMAWQSAQHGIALKGGERWG